MTTYRYIILIVALGLLSACGESKQEPAATVPEGILEDSLSAETPAPAVATEDAQSVGGVDAAAFYASRCASCHGKEALGSANLPRLAGQYPEYIENQLKLFNQRERTNDNAVMHAIVSKMTPLEMAAVAAYVSGK